MIGFLRPFMQYLFHFFWTGEVQVEYDDEHRRACSNPLSIYTALRHAPKVFAKIRSLSRPPLVSLSQSNDCAQTNISRSFCKKLLFTNLCRIWERALLILPIVAPTIPLPIVAEQNRH